MLTLQHGGTAGNVWRNVLKGFHITELSEDAAELLSQHEWVASVEENAIGEVAANKCTDCFPSSVDVPEADLWGLDRTDQASPSLAKRDGMYDYCSTGDPVRVYVVDTGIYEGAQVDNDGSWSYEFINWLGDYRVEHPSTLPDVIEGDQNCRESAQKATANAGHGTAVAAIAGGNTYGIAPGVTLVDARAVECTGEATADEVVTILDWIPTDPNRTGPSVVNISLAFKVEYGCGRPTCHPHSLVTAVSNLVNGYDIPVVAAAGNHGQEYGTGDLSGYKIYPAETAAITAGGLAKVARTGGVDDRWVVSNPDPSYGSTYGSNYGDAIDLYAPAQYVESAHILPDDGRDRRSETSNCIIDGENNEVPDTCTSGTSFAAAHVTGAVARYLGLNQTASPDMALNWLLDEAATGNGVSIDNGSGTTRPLLNVSDCQ